jgi:glyoxylase-like metal-dependent hydrolase (beta-lactamase superfamily II)
VHSLVREGIHRLTYSVPIPGAPEVNLYLFEGEESALIDTGPHVNAVYDEFREDLKAFGFDLRTLSKIVVTHAHLDHAGLAERIRNDSGAEVLIHHDDIDRFLVRPSWSAMWIRQHLWISRFWGFEQDQLVDLEHGMRKLIDLSPGVQGDWLPTSIAHDATIQLGHHPFRVIHCPGHSAGLICIVNEEEGLLLGSDHILETITPNPTVYVPTYRGCRTGLGHYLDSIHRVRDLAVEQILPGHGAPFTGLATRIDEMLRLYNDRHQTVHDLLLETDRTVLDLVDEIFPEQNLLGRYLAARELHGHLEILHHEGLIQHQIKEECGHFRAHPAPLHT